jgi:hypothetical protein
METIETSVCMDLATCPEAIHALDPNADLLWVKFLRKTGVPMSAKSKKGKNAMTDLWVDNKSRRGFIIRNFGIPSLLQRLAAAKDEISRARVWWREAAACSEGESVPDLSPDNMAVLNFFIVTTELKFKDTRFENLVKKEWADAPQLDNLKRTLNTRKRIRQARQGRKASLGAKFAAISI